MRLELLHEKFFMQLYVLPVTLHVKVPDVSISGQYLHFLFLQMFFRVWHTGPKLKLDKEVSTLLCPICKSPVDEIEVISLFGSDVLLLTRLGIWILFTFGGESLALTKISLKFVGRL